MTFSSNTHGRVVARILACALLVAACPGCDDGDGGGAASPDAGSDSGAPDGAEALRLGTWNVGLAPGFVEYATPRTPHVHGAITGSDADVLCLQEVFEADAYTGLVDATDEVFPSVLRIEPAQAFREEAACPPAELDPIRGCVEPACEGIPPEQLAACALEQCEVEFNAAGEACQGCLGANVGKSLEEIVAACGEGDEPKPVYTYDGSFGLALLSREAPAAADEIILDSTLIRRGVIYARYDRAEGPLHVFCTHLTATLSTVEYNGPAGSWGEEQAAQIEVLRAFVDEKAPAGEAVALLGDFNCGPDGGDAFAAELPENYSALSAGYENPWLASESPGCTYCFDNALVGGLDHESSGAIDHVLLRGAEAVGAARVFDEAVDIDLGDDGTLRAPPSDHYGVRVTVR